MNSEHPLLTSGKALVTGTSDGIEKFVASPIFLPGFFFVMKRRDESRDREKDWRWGNTVLDVFKTVVLGVFYLNLPTTPIEPSAVLGGLTAAALLSGVLTFMYEKGLDLQDGKVIRTETE